YILFRIPLRPPPRSPPFPYTTLFRSITRRLVGDEDERIVDQRSRDCHPLLLAAGHLAGKAGCLGSEPDLATSFPREMTGGEQQRSEEHTSELQSQSNLVCRLLLEKKK